MPRDRIGLDALATAIPAQAITLPPPGGNTLVVFAYYSDHAKTHLVGQKWSGCGQPSGQWGVTTSIFEVGFRVLLAFTLGALGLGVLWPTMWLPHCEE